MSGIQFLLPEPIKNFVFDLHEASRLSKRVDDVHVLYETTYKELTEKYFKEIAWPVPSAIADECRGDEIFLVYYREMTLRHLFSKLKPQLSDYLEAWSTYKSLFDDVMSSKKGSMCITSQWAYDILQEFVYQFQEFCQYRCQSNNTNRSAEDIEMLEANKEAWSYPAVLRLLKGVIRSSNIRTFLSTSIAPSPACIASSPQLSVGYFSMIELARLECLIGDHTASLEAISSIHLLDNTGYCVSVPASYVNMLYHAGVCFLMLRRYSDCMDTLSGLVMYVSQLLKPGATKQAVSPQFQKLMDKALTLTGVCANLCPGHRLDDQVREMCATKLGDKLRRLQLGEAAAYVESFEQSCPKFVSPSIPNYRAFEKGNRCHEFLKSQVQIFHQEVKQQVVFIRLRSYLKLYSAIEIEKLSTFNNLPEAELLNLIIAFKYKGYQLVSISNGRGTTSTEDERLVSSDIGVQVRGSTVTVETDGSSASQRGTILSRFFISSIKRHGELNKRIESLTI